jgi:hypothetical protein
MVVAELAQMAQRDLIIHLIIFVHPHRQYQATIPVMADLVVTTHILPKIVCPLNLKVAQATQVW